MIRFRYLAHSDEEEVIPATAVITSSQDHMFCELDGEAVILQFPTGTYFGLNAVGCVVWKYIQQPRTFSEVVTTVLAEFEVDRERCEADLQQLLAKLSEAGLIKVSAASDGSTPGHGASVLGC